MSPNRTAQPHGQNGRPPTMARSNITACFRCRLKKKRCDQKLPKCGLCEAAGAECIGYDPVTRRSVARSYVQSLEERVAYLESKLQESSIPGHSKQSSQISHPSPSLVRVDSALQGWTNRQEMTEGVPLAPDITSNIAVADICDKVARLEQHNPEHEPAFSKLLLDELMKLKVSSYASKGLAFSQPSSDQSVLLDTMTELETSPISLPTRETAQNLVKTYFGFANLSLPLLHEPTFLEKLELLYSLPRTVDFIESHASSVTRIAVFFVFEVFAVALLAMQKQDPARVPTSLADRYHKSALRALNEIGLPNDLEGVQILLLVGQYSYHHPTNWAVWKTVGAALRLAVELGLHQDPQPGKLDVLTLDTMRRTFWVAYAMDRNISIAMGMPSCLSDGAITAQFHSPLDDIYITADGFSAVDPNTFWIKSISIYVLRWRQIQSEMQTVLYERQSAAYPPIDYNNWQQQMHNRIQDWYDSIPNNDQLSVRERKIVGNFELTFHRAIFYLYHPSPNIPSPSDSALIAIAEATSRMIQLYRQYFDDRRLTIYWQAVENLSSGGTALLFSYVNSPQVRESLTLRSLESLVHTCSSVLWGMVEHFPAYKNKRDAFDITASKVLANLNHTTGSAVDSAGPSNNVSIDVGYDGGQTSIIHNTTIEPEIMIGNSSLYQSFPDVSTLPDTQTRRASDHNASSNLENDHRAETPDGTFTLADFDDSSFDWEAFEGTNEFLDPAWI